MAPPTFNSLGINNDIADLFGSLGPAALGAIQGFATLGPIGGIGGGIFGLGQAQTTARQEERNDQFQGAFEDQVRLLEEELGFNRAQRLGEIQSTPTITLSDGTVIDPASGLRDLPSQFAQPLDLEPGVGVRLEPTNIPNIDFTDTSPGRDRFNEAQDQFRGIPESFASNLSSTLAGLNASKLGQGSLFGSIDPESLPSFDLSDVLSGRLAGLSRASQGREQQIRDTIAATAGSAGGLENLRRQQEGASFAVASDTASRASTERSAIASQEDANRAFVSELQGRLASTEAGINAQLSGLAGQIGAQGAGVQANLESGIASLLSQLAGGESQDILNQIDFAFGRGDTLSQNLTQSDAAINGIIETLARATDILGNISIPDIAGINASAAPFIVPRDPVSRNPVSQGSRFDVRLGG